MKRFFLIVSVISIFNSPINANEAEYYSVNAAKLIIREKPTVKAEIADVVTSGTVLGHCAL